MPITEYISNIYVRKTLFVKKTSHFVYNYLDSISYKEILKKQIKDVIKRGAPFYYKDMLEELETRNFTKRYNGIIFCYIQLSIQY